MDVGLVEDAAKGVKDFGSRKFHFLEVIDYFGNN